MQRDSELFPPRSWGGLRGGGGGGSPSLERRKGTRGGETQRLADGGGGGGKNIAGAEMWGPGRPTDVDGGWV